ncbi:MAG: hypothetical protein FWG81_05385, partial [Betaproteobacteria bacterium]|nr:hypothetical protein [Betaproteobacteria bacterium]
MATETIEVRYQPFGPYTVDPITVGPITVDSFTIGSEDITGLTFYHTVVVYTDSNGDKWAARGGAGDGGMLRTRVEPYNEDHEDWSEPGVDKSSIVASGENLSGTWEKIVAGFNGIDGNGIYGVFFNNCNTATAAGLKNAGLDFPYHPDIKDIEVPGEGFQWWDKFKDWLSENYDWFKNWLGEKYDQIANEVNDLYLKARHLLVVDPLVLDLDGDGQISTVGMNGYKTVLFDHDGDGVRTGTGWVLPNDGFLVIDRNGNGVIDNGTELFGVGYVKQDGELALNGLDALSDLDSNEDGVFDANDAAFNQVKVWRDLNQDGISQANELFSLAALGITSIDLSGTAVRENLGDGNVMTATASYTMADGTEGLVANLDLSDNPFYREVEEKIPLSEETYLLPNMQGSGNLRDLREAAELSPHLAQSLQMLTDAGLMDRAEYLTRVELITLDWIETGRDSFTSSWEAAAEGGMLLYYVPSGLTGTELRAVFDYLGGARMEAAAG